VRPPSQLKLCCSFHARVVHQCANSYINSFGGFATKYIKGKFFMDVHPPLAKMLIALTGWLAGFDGSFDFKEIGKDYIEPGVPYVAMRMFPAICGILLVPCMFFTLKAVGCRTMTATMGAGLIIFGSYLSWPFN
jgi:dolichyl-phosphate-mannose-protein mannosyltransferase